MSLHYSPNIVSSGLVLCLDAGDPRSYPGSGTVWADRSGLGNNGTLVNGVGYSSANRGGLVFDGVNDHVTIAGTRTLTSATFICWIRPSTTQRGFTGIFFTRGGGGGTTGIGYNNGGTQLGYHWNDAVNTYGWNSGLLIPANVWSFCAVTITPTQAIAYLYNSNGQSSAINNVNHASATLPNLVVGWDPGVAGRYFIGSISQSLLYNRALSPAEIQQNFEATRSRFGI